MNLHLPRAEIQSMLDKLGPYKDSQQIGGSKSMVLESEYSFLSSCGKDAEALAKAQEAFASQIDKSPSYDDSVYFEDLVTAYRLNGQIPDAWTVLRRWRREGSTKFANTKRNQLMAELRLYYCLMMHGTHFNASRRKNNTWAGQGCMLAHWNGRF